MNAPSRFDQLQAQRRQLLEQIAALDQIRRGSITEQFVHAKCRDGSTVRRGPYRLYTYKHKAKTVSRRLTDPAEATAVRQQIDGFRQFQRLTAELLRIGEQLSDLALQQPDALKKTTRSKSSSTLK
jgi:hypothetical protein